MIEHILQLLLELQLPVLPEIFHNVSECLKSSLSAFFIVLLKFIPLFVEYSAIQPQMFNKLSVFSDVDMKGVCPVKTVCNNSDIAWCSSGEVDMLKGHHLVS